MLAQEIPKFLLCQCGQPMNVQITAKLASCTNPACAEAGKQFELPVRELELTEKPAE